jgi:hypothetical protein
MRQAMGVANRLPSGPVVDDEGRITIHSARPRDAAALKAAVDKALADLNGDT